MSRHLNLVTNINGEQVSRRRVLGWELGRAKSVLKFLGSPVAGGEDDVDLLRRSLYDLKREMGPDALQRRVAARVRVADAGSAMAARFANGRRVLSAIKVTVPTGTAEEFADWFNAESALADSDAMLAACPDHYFIGEDDRGRQKVVETTGGSPLPTSFYIDYQDVSSLTSPESADHPIRIAGVARTARGLAIGGVRHQFRNLPAGGFESFNTVEFPTGVPRRMIDGHRWHLACEFGNWIEFHQMGLLQP